MSITTETNPKVSVSQRVKDVVRFRNPDAVSLPELYDNAIVGYTDDNRIVYDIEDCVSIMMNESNCDRRSAEIKMCFVTDQNSKISDISPVFIHFPEEQ